MPKKLLSKNLLTSIAINSSVLLVTLIIIEICFQVLTRIDGNNTILRTLRHYTMYRAGRVGDDDFFKQHFIERYEEENGAKIPLKQRELEPHPELGWVPRENAHIKKENGDTVTINSMGFRSLKDYSTIDHNKYVVLILGDSFTYGSDADDSEVWPTLLQKFDNTLEVLNLGVPAYGTDQMYLLLKKYIAQFQPDLVIAAVYWDDVYRTLLSFRLFQKPKFELQNGELYLTNTPIGELEDVYERLKEEMGYKRIFSEIRILNIVRNAIFQVQERHSKKSVNYKELNEKIFQRMLETCQQHQADFLLLYVPAEKELIDPDYPAPVADFLEEFAKNNTVQGLNPREDFLKSAYFVLSKDSMIYLRDAGVPEDIVGELKPLKHQKFVKERKFLEAAEKQIGKEQTTRYQQQILASLDWQYEMGHYQKKEAAILAQAVYKKIATLSSYLKFAKK